MFIISSEWNGDQFIEIIQMGQMEDEDEDEGSGAMAVQRLPVILAFLTTLQVNCHPDQPMPIPRNV